MITDLQKSILEYLLYKNGSPCGINNLHDAFFGQASEEDIENALNFLKQSGYIEYFWDCGSMAQIFITDKGRDIYKI